MKKTILFLSLFVATFAQAQTQNQIETKMNPKNKLYKEHKKQLIEQNKIYQEEKRKKGINTDSLIKNEDEVVDFSTGKPVKK